MLCPGDGDNRNEGALQTVTGGVLIIKTQCGKETLALEEMTFQLWIREL